jgi:uncharacterized protein (DUF4415 family)/uncharacterized DUF497 family protein
METWFDWDPVKAASNLRKHGVSFHTAMRAFADPFALTEQDRIEEGEYRWRTLGMVEEHLMLVAHTIENADEDGQPIRLFVSFQPERLTEKKGDAMSKKFVRQSVDLNNLPPLTKKQKAELAALSARSDGEIDYTDIPPLTERFWNGAVRGRFYKPAKTSTTVRIDSDVLAWLRAPGKGYQSRINAILRREMLSLLAKGADMPQHGVDVVALASDTTRDHAIVGVRQLQPNRGSLVGRVRKAKGGTRDKRPNQ